VDVPGAKPAQAGGGIYYVDVFERRATLFERLWPGLRDGATIVPAGALNPPGISEKERFASDRHAMQLSQQIATAVALRALGYDAKIRGGGVHVDGVYRDSHAYGRLHSGDVVLSVDGKPVNTIPELRAALQRHRVGDSVRLRVRQGAAAQTIDVRLSGDPTQPKRPVIGILPSPALDVHLPFKVKFDIGNVGGPSAGLAFALQLLEERGRNVDHGYRVAATGELEPDGSVVRIGGVEQKTIGARRAHVDVFLVPVDGGNAAEARRYAHGLRIVPVQSFQQALHALATLPPKGGASADRAPGKDPQTA
jgi:PDZ domain-containing protein